MCLRGSSQIIKIVLEMLISGIFLSEKHPKTCQLGLWQSTKISDTIEGTRSLILTLKRYDKHPHPFPIAFFPPAPENKDLPLVEKKGDLLQSPPPQKSNGPYLLHNSKMSFVPERNEFHTAFTYKIIQLIETSIFVLFCLFLCFSRSLIGFTQI